MTANPDGTFTKGECDYVLGPSNSNYGASNYVPFPDAKAIGSTTVKNTGNVGVVLVVKAYWQITGAPSIRGQNTVRLDVGQRKRVRFSEAIPPDRLDQLQNAAFHSHWCGVSASIVDTYGAVQS